MWFGTMSISRPIAWRRSAAQNDSKSRAEPSDGSSRVGSTVS
jgi:hypothetical protein